MGALFVSGSGRRGVDGLTDEAADCFGAAGYIRLLPPPIINSFDEFCIGANLKGLIQSCRWSRHKPPLAITNRM